MTEPRPTRRPAWLETLVFGAAAAVLLVAAARVMFSAFMFYDDEGYVLYSLRNFSEHGGLYRDVYSQYGPFPFVFHHLVQLTGIPLTHTTGRLITLGAWAGAALLGALLAGRVARSLVARLAVLAGLFAYLWVMASEPTHPGGLIVLLTTLAAVLGHHWLERDRPGAWALLAGAVTAALLLTKINVGLFLAFAAGAWLLLHHRDDRVRRAAPAVVLVVCAALPPGLMRPLLGAEWVRDFALVWAAGGAAVVLAGAAARGARAGWDTLAWGALAAALTGGAVVAVTLTRGSSVADLLDGILLAPLRQPTTFSIRYLWAPGIGAVALLSLTLAAIAAALRRRGRAVDTPIAAARILAALALAANLLRFPAASADYLTFGWLLPCLWLFAWPLAGEAERTSQARAWVILVLLGQCLHVFPVAGSQIAWGTLLALPVAAAGAWDAAAWLARRHGTAASAPRWRTAGRVALLGAAVFAVTVGRRFQAVGERYAEGEYLGLPGAEALRLPAGSSAVFRLLTQNAAAHADVLFSEPGMFSFNVWSGVPAPTRANVTHWFSLLGPERQAAIAARLRAHPRAVVILHREHVDFLRRRGLAPKGPLHDLIAQEFEPVFSIDDFEFRVHRGRRLTPFLVGELRTRAAEAGPAAGGENTLLTLPLLLPPAAPVARLEVSTPPGAPGGPLRLDAGNARLELTRLSPRGEPLGPPAPAAWPLRIDGPTALAVYYNRDGRPRPEAKATLTLRDAAGAEVGLGRLRD